MNERPLRPGAEEVGADLHGAEFDLIPLTANKPVDQANTSLATCQGARGQLPREDLRILLEFQHPENEEFAMTFLKNAWPACSLLLIALFSTVGSGGELDQKPDAERSSSTGPGRRMFKSPSSKGSAVGRNTRWTTWFV
jgi:hypothetical protein